MIYQQRDLNINYMKARKNHTCYGMGIGIMVLDDAYPGFPGDVRNASGFGYPVQYDIAKPISIYAEPGIAYYFDDKSVVETIRKEQPLCASVQFGVRFAF